jgi:hypothetical protein
MTLQVIGTKVRMLVGAVVVAAALAAVAAAPAFAQPSSPDNGVRCVLRLGPGQYAYYLPGESIFVTTADGHYIEFRCGQDGNWYQPRTQPTTPSGPANVYGSGSVTLLPDGRFNRINGVIAPTPSSATTAASGGSKPVTARRGR